MNDKSSVLQIIGSLMKHPQYLSEVDKYNLTPFDFSSRFERNIFIAIDTLYRNGATNITPVDMENFLETNAAAKAIFNQQNGIEYLQDAVFMAEEGNFPYYYNRLKKINLLNSLQKEGINTSEFYMEDLSDPKAIEVNQKFESLEIKDILDGIKKRLLGIEREYNQNDTTEVKSAFEGIEDILLDAEEKRDIGLPLQGEIFNEVTSGARLGTLYIRSGSSGVSKALPNSTKIPTPKGWKTVEEIKVGDCLFDAFGKPTKVLGVFPQGRKEVYAVTFKDGRIAKCCKEHLWSFNTASQKKHSRDQRKFYTEELQDIIKRPLQKPNGQYNILVPMNKAVEYSTKEYYIPPYVFGLMVGDGSFRQSNSNKSFKFSSENCELPNHIAEQMGWILKKASQDNFTWYFATKETKKNQFDKINVWVEDVLREYPELLDTYCYNKWIPQKYLEGDIQQRIDLLNGLLDTDGSIDLKGRVSYATTSKQLRDNVIELVQSLGMKATFVVSESERKYPLYKINVIASKEQKTMLFNLQRKVDRRNQYINNGVREEKNTHNPIINIKSLGYEEEMTCFRVDNDEHLFLMNDFIVTHNTRQSVGDACFLAYPVRYDMNKQKWVKEGNNQKILFIATEQDFKEITKMIIAYLTGMNESRFRYGNFSVEERIIIKQATLVMKKYEDNFFIVRMPNPTIELVKTIVRENCLVRDINYVFYDYIFIGPSLLGEFKGFNLRNDKLLSYI